MSFNNRSNVLFFSLARCIAILAVLTACDQSSDIGPDFELVSLQANNTSLLDSTVSGVSLNGPIIASFNLSVDTVSFKESIDIGANHSSERAYRFSFFNDNKSVSIYPLEPFDTYTTYTISFSDLESADGKKRFTGSGYKFITLPGQLTLESIKAGNIDISKANERTIVPFELGLEAVFSSALNAASVTTDNVYLQRGSHIIATTTTVNENVLTIQPAEEIDYWRSYHLIIEESVSGTRDIDFSGFETSFTVGLDSTYKYAEISDDALLTKVQSQTFKYFWDFGHPISGLARERNTSGETVTSGGSGFGLMAILVGIERGFITRAEGLARIKTIVEFLSTKADRFHGVWPHWLNGTSGKTRPFSSNDDGGDLVETAFMVQGLLTVRQYLDEQSTQESGIIDQINMLWEGVEWDWYTQGGQDVLYWHWSPNFGWEKNHRITGWNEAMIVYVLAASSPTHTIDKEVYTKGWSRNGAMRNSSNATHYGYQMDLRSDRGGPLFFSHYSFLGLDPRKLSDQFANYWEQNVNHSKINQAYCTANPKRYLGYSADCWGLTASDNHQGYNAHSPDNDLGVITPTAAISSIPYTPEESMAAIRHFYYILGDRLWGTYGFYDAFNPTENWTASSYLAIDQGPIIVMIENHRTGLLWDLFMSAPEIQNGLAKLEITYE